MEDFRCEGEGEGGGDEVVRLAADFYSAYVFCALRDGRIRIWKGGLCRCAGSAIKTFMYS